MRMPSGVVWNSQELIDGRKETGAQPPACQPPVSGGVRSDNRAAIRDEIILRRHLLRPVRQWANHGVVNRACVLPAGGWAEPSLRGRHLCRLTCFPRTPMFAVQTPAAPRSRPQSADKS